MKYLILMVLFSQAAFAKNLEEIQKTGTIRLAVDGESKPFNYFEGKELKGFEVDLLKEIAARKHLKIEWVVQPFGTLLVGINQDRFDVIVTSHAKTEAREKVADFLNPLYCTGAILISKPNGPKTIAELKGKTVVTMSGTVYFEKLKTIPGIKEVRTLPTEMDGLQALLADRADAWVTDKIIADEAVKTHKAAKIATGEIVLNQINAHVVAKGNSTLKKFMNDAFAELVKDGTYMKLAMKHVGSDIQCK